MRQDEGTLTGVGKTKIGKDDRSKGEPEGKKTSRISQRPRKKRRQEANDEKNGQDEVKSKGERTPRILQWLERRRQEVIDERNVHDEVKYMGEKTPRTLQWHGRGRRQEETNNMKNERSEAKTEAERTPRIS